MANCNCREEPESPVAKRVLLITPNVFTGIKGFVALTANAGFVATSCAPRPGCPKFGWLNKSKASKRISWVILSVILVLLISEKSTLLKPGPIIELRPWSPKCSVPDVVEIENVEPEQLGENARVGSQSEGVKYWMLPLGRG